MVTLKLFILIVAFVLSALSVFRSNGKSEISWAILLVTIYLLLPLVIK